MADSKSVPVKSSLNSAITSDSKAPADDTVTVDMSKATFPASAVSQPAPKAAAELTEAEEAALEKTSLSFEQRAVDAGIGLVRVEGIDFRYIGVAPGRDKDPKTPGGYPITSENSTFTPLANTVFHPSVRIKDPASGEFYYPADGALSYNDAEYEGNPLIAKEADKKAGAARKEALLASKG